MVSSITAQETGLVDLTNPSYENKIATFETPPEAVGPGKDLTYHVMRVRVRKTIF